MGNFIVEKFNEIIYKACERYGKENNEAADNIQILFRVDENNDVVYDLLKGYKKIRRLTFNDILNVRIDFRGYSLLVPPFIHKTLTDYAGDMGVKVTNLSAICVIIESGVVLCLYKGLDFVKQIDIDEEL